MQINNNAQEIIESRYLWLEKGEKTWDDACIRVGSIIGEATNNSSHYVPKFIESMSSGLFIPGGRIVRNTGRPRGSMFNCYNVPWGDSIEEIMDGISACGKLWKDGGGTGVTLSTLRPSNTPLLSSGGVSSGPLPFLLGANEVAKAIRTGGQRRAAGLALLSVSHPDILDFINCKKKDGDVSLFNISVGITEDFIDSVRQDREWPLMWRNQIYKTVNARDLWNEIITGLNNNGEPGIINLDNLTVNNSYYFAPIVGCNPCGEACLEAWGVCNLGSIVIKNFVSNGRMKWSLLEEVIDLVVRFLDHAIDVNVYTLPQIKQAAQRGRRIGAGIMGLADLFFEMKLRYGSKDALEFTEKLMKFIRNVAYESSIRLAVERGTFPAFDSNPYCKSKFVRTLPVSIRQDIRKHGIRNVTLMAMAPTGTISLIPECTSGIEPLSYKAYKRKDNVSTRYYVHPTYANHLLSGSDVPDYIIDSTDLKPIDHIEIQTVIQKYTDGAVSKTINVPNDFSDDSLSELLLETISDLKGITVYRDGSREGQPIIPISEAEAKKIVSKNNNSTVIDEDLLSCARGSCEI